MLILGTFIDELGTFMLFPFFSLYIYDHFNATMTQVGFLFTALSIGHIFGGMIGGVVADKYGRKVMMVFGLTMSGIGSIAMGLVNDMKIFYVIALILGILGSAGGPAHHAMVIDLLPAEKRAEGFGMLRVMVNLSATIGPALGGLLAAQSYMLLFIADAVASVITAIFVVIIIPETKPQPKEDKVKESLTQTIRGYIQVINDGMFILFVGISALESLVYMQMNSSLSVFLRDSYNFSPAMFGWLLTTNASMVVLFQFWITHKISKYPPLIMMALGSILYAIGFGMFGIVTQHYLFFIAMAIITIGEMMIAPFNQKLVADFASEDKRGRYMAIFGLNWTIPNLFGVLAAGSIMDNYDPLWVWYLCSLICMIVFSGYLSLYRITKTRFSRKDQQKPTEVSNEIKNTN